MFPRTYYSVLYSVYRAQGKVFISNIFYSSYIYRFALFAFYADLLLLSFSQKLRRSALMSPFSLVLQVPRQWDMKQVNPEVRHTTFEGTYKKKGHAICFVFGSAYFYAKTLRSVGH